MRALAQKSYLAKANMKKLNSFLITALKGGAIALKDGAIALKNGAIPMKDGAIKPTEESTTSEPRIIPA